MRDDDDVWRAIPPDFWDRYKQLLTQPVPGYNPAVSLDAPPKHMHALLRVPNADAYTCACGFAITGEAAEAVWKSLDELKKHTP